MNYAALKANVTALLNTPAMEQIGVMTVDDDYNDVPIPGDYLQIVSLSVNGREISRGALSTVQNLAENGSGCPTLYARSGPRFVLGPTPQEGDEITIVYRADFSNLAADADTNWMTEVIPDILTYAALVEATAYFTDPR